MIFGGILTENDTRISDKESSQTDVNRVENAITYGSDFRKISLKTKLSEKDVKF